MKRFKMLLMFVVIGALAAGGYWSWQKWGASDPGPAPKTAAKEKGKGKGKGRGAGGPLFVKATSAVVKPMPVLIEAVGTVESEHSVQVRAQVSGVLKSVMFKEGDNVKAGQLLFQIDPRTFEAAYQQAQAQLARDQAQLENSRVQQERLAPLLQREFITRQEYDVAVTSVKSLEAVVAADRAQVEQARIQLEFSRIHAPISGRTGSLMIKPGNLVAAGGGSGVPLVTINSTDPILVAFSVPERQLEEIRRGQDEKEMYIEILTDRSASPVARGKLTFIDNTVTPQTGTVLLKTRVENPREVLWPGQFVNVRVVLRIERDAVVVPEAAVQPGQDGPFVYVIDEDNKVRVQPVKIARQIGNDVVIASGVKAGGQVITEIPQALQEGATVRLAAAEGEEKKGKGKGKGKGKKEGDGAAKAAEGEKPETVAGSGENKAGPKQNAEATSPAQARDGDQAKDRAEGKRKKGEGKAGTSGSVGEQSNASERKKGESKPDAKS